jgi:hypothetical protein
LDPIIDVACSFVPVYFEEDFTSGSPGLTEKGRVAVEEMMMI